MSGFLHSRGPWSYVRNPENTRFIVDDVAGRAIACTAGCEPDNEANAARIISCVNACDAAGLTNEALDAGVLGEIICLLDELYGELSADNMRDGPRCLLLTRIEAALAKIGGGA